MSKSSPLDKSLLLVVALEEEISEDMQKMHTLATGVGKINATLILNEYLINHPEVEVVLNLGTAGSIRHKVGEVLRCVKFIERDMIAGDQLGLTPREDKIFIEDHPVKFCIANENTHLCATGDQFVYSKNDVIRCKSADVFDMEGYALAKVCKRRDVDFICYKVVSDILGENNGNEWEAFLEKGRAILKAKYFEVLELHNKSTK